MYTPCILIANEPRCYREAIALALQNLRPLATVIALQPNDLVRAMQRLQPDIVVCDEPPDKAEQAGHWIVLYPKGESTTIINVAGQRSETGAMDLATLMSYVDQAILTHMG